MTNWQKIQQWLDEEAAKRRAIRSMMDAKPPRRRLPSPGDRVIVSAGGFLDGQFGTVLWVDDICVSVLLDRDKPVGPDCALGFSCRSERLRERALIQHFEALDRAKKVNDRRAS